MAIENLTSDITNQAQQAADMAYKSIIDKIMPILKIGGIVIAAYIIYLITKAILNFRNRNRIKRIDKNVEEILEILKSKKTEKVEKEEAISTEKKKTKKKKEK